MVQNLLCILARGHDLGITNRELLHGGISQLVKAFDLAGVGSKRLPWHGQSQLFSVVFQWTRQARCVQTGDSALSSPLALR